MLKKRALGWMAGLATVGSAVLLTAAAPASSADKSAAETVSSRLSKSAAHRCGRRV